MSDAFEPIPPAPGAPASEAVSMDPAQQSLAEALRITFRLLQAVMVLLFILFLASGFQTVEESERGVKLVFGRVVQEDVPPGVTWNWPFPVGELVKVKTGQQQLDIQSTFGPKFREADRARSLLEALGRGSAALRPEDDGSVITGDGNLAHTWWRVIWVRAAPAANARNIYTVDEEAIVQRAVERGVVRAVAEVSIDRLLKQGAGLAQPGAARPDDAAVGGGGAAAGGPSPETTRAAVQTEGSLGSRARAIAQETLDAMDSGIRIDQLILSDKSPPGRVLEQFDLVSRAEAQAAKMREEADEKARQELNMVAGEAHSAMLALIDEHERALELGEHAKAEEALQSIYRLAEGEPVVIAGVEVRASGRVTSIISEARQYRTDMVASAQTRAARFEAKVGTYRQNPAFFVAMEWAPAYKAFAESGKVETVFLPPDAPLEILLTRDPDIPQEAERERNREEATTSLTNLVEERDRAHRQAQEKARLEKQNEKKGGN